MTEEDGRALLETLKKLTQEWNEGSARWVAAYASPDTTYEEFVRISSEVEKGHFSAIVSARLSVAGLPDSLTDLAEPVFDNYSERLRIFGDLISAILNSDDEAFSSLGEEYANLTSRTTFEPILRRIVESPELSLLFEADGNDADDVINAILGTLP